MTTITLVDGRYINGVSYPPGSTVTVEDDLAAELVQQGLATYATAGGMFVLKSLGDSRPGQHYHDSSDSANSVIELAIGDAYTAPGPQYVAAYLSCGDLEVKEYAVSGSRLASTGESTTDAEISQMALALADGNPATEGLAIFSGFNDRNSGVADSRVVQALDSIVERGVSSGRDVMIALEPVQRSANWQPTSHAALLAAQYAAIERHRGDGKVYAADCYSPTVGGNGEAFPDGSANNPYSSGDHVHYRYHGAYDAGQAYYDALMARGRLKPGAMGRNIAADLAASADNLLTNPTFTGSGGTASWASGTMPTSWTAVRSPSNSWDKLYGWGATHTLRVSSTVYALYDRMSTPANPGFMFVATTVAGAATSAASAPTFSEVLGATTVDGDITWTTVPYDDRLDGVGGWLLVGLGTVNNTRGIFRQDWTLASKSLAVGDVIRGSIYHIALMAPYSYQLELRAMIGTTKVPNGSTFGNLGTLPNTTTTGVYPRGGKMRTAKSLNIEGWAIPATATDLSFRFTAFSAVGLLQMHVISSPFLRQIG